MDIHGGFDKDVIRILHGLPHVHFLTIFPPHLWCGDSDWVSLVRRRWVSEQAPPWLQILRFHGKSKSCAWFRFPGWSQVKRPLNSRCEDCWAGGMGDGPNPETEDVNSPRIEDCEPMRTVSMHGWRLHRNRFEEDQIWLEEDQSQPETGYRT